MVVPLQCGPGTNRPLAVPDSSNSYVWQGKKTSAQYYVNNSGLDVKDGCKWGKPDGGIGNWAPLVRFRSLLMVYMNVANSLL